MTEMMSPRWMTNCANLAERRYELRPFQRSSLVRWLNWVTEKSAARNACLPSLPTMPTPAVVSVSIAFAHGVSTKMGQRTDIGSLDHAHIVPAIADTTNALFGEISDNTRDVYLLRRRTPVRDDSAELGRDHNKLVLKQGKAELQWVRERDKHVIGFGVGTWSDSPSMMRSSLFCKKSGNVHSVSSLHSVTGTSHHRYNVHLRNQP